MNERDAGYLLDMLLSARIAREHIAGIDRARFEIDLLIQDAVMRRLQVIGEAANHVSETTRAEHPEIPWREATGLRHRLVHDYRRLRLETLWSVVWDELPALIAALEPLIPPEDAS